jgi:voltage-gated potassium channel
MVVRALVTLAALVVLYYWLPMTGVLDTAAIARLVVGLLVFAVLIAWLVRAIVRSAYPGLRAIEGLAVGIPLLLVLFASTYLMMANAEAQAFTEPLSKTNDLYFTVTVYLDILDDFIAKLPEGAESGKGFWEGAAYNARYKTEIALGV